MGSTQQPLGQRAATPGSCVCVCMGAWVLRMLQFATMKAQGAEQSGSEGPEEEEEEEEGRGRVDRSNAEVGVFL